MLVFISLTRCSPMGNYMSLCHEQQLEATSKFSLPLRMMRILNPTIHLPRISSIKKSSLHRYLSLKKHKSGWADGWEAAGGRNRGGAARFSRILAGGGGTFHGRREERGPNGVRVMRTRGEREFQDGPHR